MLVTKKINNNVAVCLDGNGRELIAFGKGIGFPATPYELTDLSKVDRSFYHISPIYWSLFNSIPENIINFTVRILDQVRGWLPYETNPNTVLTLADHIAFAIQREKAGVYIQMPTLYQIEQDYPLEVKIGRHFLEAIKQQFGVTLPKGEISGIAMHFINARKYPMDNRHAASEEVVSQQYEDILEQTVQIVEWETKISIKRDTFNYRRFATHLDYLLKRIFKQQHIDTDNQQIYEMMRREYPTVAQCVDKIANFYQSRLSVELTSEEKLYLILHINRICAKTEE